MNNRHRRVARLKQQELNECGISTEKAAEVMKSFEMAAAIYGLNSKEVVEAKRSFELFVYGIPKVTASLGKIFRGK